MDNNIIFSTPHNSYLYSYNHKEFIPAHPVIKRIMETKNISSVELLYEDEELAGYSRSEIDYYWGKYNYLKKQGFIAKKNAPVFGGMTSDLVRRQLETSKVITFEVTDRCNLRCRYCGYGDMYSGYDERETKNMDFATAKAVIDHMFGIWDDPKLRSNHRTVVIGFYGGEPLMNFELIRQIVEYTSHRRIGNLSFRYNMTTNAVLLDKYMDYLQKHRIQLLISLDGTDIDNCQRVDKANKPSFEHVFGNIKKLQKNYPGYFKNEVTFNSVIHKDSDIERIVAFFKKEFDKQTTLSELNNSGIIQKDKYSSLYRSVLGSFEKSPRSKSLDRRLGYKSPRMSSLNYFLINLADNVFKDYRNLLYGDKNHVLMPGGTCLPFSKKMFVTVNGKILACERIDHDFALGQVEGDKILLDEKEISDQYNEYYKKLKTQCKQCYMHYSCSQCLYYTNINDGKMRCHAFKNKREFSDYMASNMHYLENTRWAYSYLMEKITLY